MPRRNDRHGMRVGATDDCAPTPSRARLGRLTMRLIGPLAAAGIALALGAAALAQHGRGGGAPEQVVDQALRAQERASEAAERAEAAQQAQSRAQAAADRAQSRASEAVERAQSH